MSEETHEEIPHENVPKKGPLIAVGIIELVIGALVLLAAAAVAGTMGMVKSAAPELKSAQMLPAVLVYAGAAAFFIAMGIGTIRVKRWARSFMLVASWFTAVCGAVVLLVLFTGLSQFIALQIPIETRYFSRAIFVIIGIAVGIFFIVIPAVFILLYSLKGTKKAFQYYDTKKHWTDRVSLPELSFVLLLWFSALSSLISTAAGLPFPFFGVFISGTGARLLWAAFTLGLGYLGYACYRRDKLGWIVSMAVTVLLLISSMLTFSLSGIDQFYRLYYPQAQQFIGNYSQLDRTFTRSFLYIIILYAGYFVFLIRVFLRTVSVKSRDPR